MLVHTPPLTTGILMMTEDLELRDAVRAPRRNVWSEKYHVSSPFLRTELKGGTKSLCPLLLVHPELHPG